MAEPPTDLELRCETCSRRIDADHPGGLVVDTAKAEARALALADADHHQHTALAAFRAETLHVAIAAAEHDPPVARWVALHDRCPWPQHLPPADRGYVIDADSIRTTWQRALTWTVHLSGKPWLDGTDWRKLWAAVLHGSDDRVWVRTRRDHIRVLG